MGTITGYTAEFIQAVLDGTIADADVAGGSLIFTRTDGTTFNAGNVQGPTGATGPAGPTSIQIVTSATRPGSPIEGQYIHETDTDRFYYWNGTAWIEKGIGVILCTAATRPTASLYNGMRIYETDTKRNYIYDGTGWMYVGGASPAVIAAALQNSWVNFGDPWQPAGYYKDGSGVVHIEGMIKNGTTASTTLLFTLPAGYRPPKDSAFVTKSVEGTSQDPQSVNVTSTGRVEYGTMSGSAGQNDALSLDGITFRATQ